MAFDEEEEAFLVDVLAGFIEVEEGFTFMEDGGFWGVDVFGVFSWVIVWGEGELSAGEGDDSSLDIADGDDEAAAEAWEEIFWVIIIFFREEEAAGFEGFGGEVFYFEEGLEEGVWGGWGEAD